MQHLRRDYQRIQDPLGKIGEDEPVFLIRGKDLAAVPTITAWAQEAARLGADKELCRAVLRFANYVEWWQYQNACKVPDTPLEELRPELQHSIGSCPTSGGSS